MAKREIALLLCVSMIISLFCSCASKNDTTVSEISSAVAEVDETNANISSVNEEQKDKSETVYAEAGADGTINKITVEGVLKNTGDGKEITDTDTLTNLENTEGDEEFIRKNGVVIWENHGEDIHYKGTTTQELPVNIKVSYKLNGENISATELAGKSGTVTIRFDYSNNTTQSITVDRQVLSDENSDENNTSLGDESFSTEKVELNAPVPFMAVTALFLDSETFSNIKVTNGKTADMDDNCAVIGYALPGLKEYLQLGDYEQTEDITIPDYVEVSADTTDFSLSFTATVLTSDFLSDLETDKLDDFEETIAGLDVLQDASKDLVDGTGELADGMDKFSDYLSKYKDGVDAVSDGAKQLTSGLKKLNASTSDLKDGASALSDGLEMLQESLSAMDLSGLTNALSDDDETKIHSALEKITSDKNNIEAFLESVSKTIDKIETFSDDLSAYEKQVNQEIKASEDLLDAVNLSDLEDEAKQQAGKAVESALKEYALTDNEKAAIKKSVQNSIDLSNSISKIKEQLEKVRSHLQDIPDSLKVPDLSVDIDTISTSVSDIKKQLETVEAYSKAYSGSLQGSLTALEQSMRTLTDGISQLSTGSTQLTKGLSAYSTGVSAIYEGSKGLYSGTKKLSSSGGKLNKSFEKVVDAMKELHDGFKEFDEKGIQKLTDFANDKLSNLISDIKALKVTDDAYNSFTGVESGKSSEVKFIIETAEISSD